jgi:heme O synthase-like polyprenyltransferase
MSARIAARNAKRRNRTITYTWILALAALTIALIYWELTALLYVLATLGVTALLIVVALSDIAHAEKSTAQGSLATPSTTATNVTQGVGKTDWGTRKRS